jgi:hypothetical protein
MTSVTGGFWTASADASRGGNAWSAARPRAAADSALGMAAPERRSAAAT